MLNILKNTINRVFASGVDSDASAFITATGLSGTTQKSAITTLVKDLKSSGLWSKMKAVYPMVTDNYNLLSYTEDFSNAFWTKTNANVSLNASTAPNGTNTANSIIPTTTNGFHLLTSPYSLTTTSNTVVYSGYFKANGYNYISILVPNNGSLSKYFEGIFNISTGNIEPTGRASTYTGTRNIVSVGNGWYRCSLTITNADLNATHGAWIVPMATNDTSVTYSGNGTSGIYAWGAQFQMDTLSTYQPILTTPSAFMASQMKYNLKDARDLDAAFRLTWSGGWTYSATGATPNGTNAYADTKLNASTTLTNNNYHLSHYSRTQKNTGSEVDLGAAGSAPVMVALDQFYAGAGKAFVAGDYVTSAITVLSATNTLGMQVNTRPSQTSAKIFFNNSQVGSTLTLSNPNALPNTKFFLGANSGSNVPQEYSSKQTAFATIGDGLSDQDASLLNQIVEKYQVALSRGVQAAQSFYYNSAYSNEANTYLYSTQITGTTQVSAINTLINGLKANNLWSKMKAVYPFVTDYRNLLGYTEDYSNAVWSKNNSSIAVNQITAPNGTLTGNGLVDNATNAGHSFNNATGLTVTANNYTLSVYAKKGNKDWIYLNIYNGTNDAFAWFNLNTGITGTVQSGLTSSIQDAGNGWYRVSITRNLPVTSNCYVQYGASNTDNSTTFVGTGTYNIYLWGTQFELGTLSNYQQVLTTSANYMSNQMKFNLVNPQDSDAAFRLAFSGGWTYSTNGAQPNGTNGYADTKLIPNTNLALNSASFSVYSRTNFTPLTNQSWGVSSSSLFIPLIGSTIDTTTRITSFVYDYRSPDGLNSATGLNFAAMFLTSRVSAASAKSYRNLTQLASVTTQGQTTQPTTSFTFGAFRNSSSFQDYNNFQYGFAHIGDGLSDAEVTLFYQLVQQFQTDLSRQV